MALAELSSSPLGRLPEDVLHHIFTLSLPNSYPPFSQETQGFNYVTSAAPHNVACVCRSWRGIVLSHPSLWSTLFHSLDCPSIGLLETFIRVIKQHLQRSGNLPLTCFLRLQGEYDVTLSRKIINILAARQQRWRRIGFHFTVDCPPPQKLFRHSIDYNLNVDYNYNDDCNVTYNYISSDDYNADGIIDTSYNYYNDHKLNDDYDRDSYEFDHMVDETPTPVPAVNLVTENLKMLEELHLNFADQYTFCGRKSSGFDQPNHDTLPSLTHLDLEASNEWTPIRWLVAAAHITELNLTFCEPPREPSLSHLPRIELPELRIIRASNPGRGDLKAVAAEFVLRFITCPMLRELYLCLNCEAEVELFAFLQRSMPRLQILDLDLSEPPSFQQPPASRYRRIFDSLSLIPSLREFIVRWSGLGDVGDILKALKRMRDPATPHASFALLPALENLVLVIFSAELSPSKFINLIAARWKAHETTFKSFTLTYHAVDYTRNSLLFSGWTPNGGYSRLPRAWDRVAPLVSEGLRFRITFKEIET